MHNLQEIAQKTLRSLQNAGADKAQCTVRATETHEFNIDGGKFSLFRTLFDNSLFMTALVGGRKGTITVNHFDDDAIHAAVTDCLSIAASGTPDPAWDFAPGIGSRRFTDGCPTVDADRLFDRTQELMKEIADRHPTILMEQMIVTHQSHHTVYQNSLGADFEEISGEYEIDLMYSAHEGEATSSFFSSQVITDTLDRPFLEMGSIEEDLSRVEKQIRPTPLSGKFTGVAVFPPTALESFLGSILGNFTSDSTILDGTSVWRDKLGQRVADERITLSCAPRDSRIVCGERVTYEGFLSENYDVIRNGILESFQLSQYVANKTGLPRAKNSTDALVMEPGDVSFADMIAGIAHGILVGRFSGGEPGTSGDFSGVAKNSFLIENGKITCALSETMINGNLADMLNNVSAISREVVCSGYSVLPYAAFDGITVSGK